MGDTLLDLKFDLNQIFLKVFKFFPLPLLLVINIVIFSGILTILFMNCPKSLKAIENVVVKNKTIFVVIQKDLKLEDHKEDNLFEIVNYIYHIPDDYSSGWNL